MDTESVELEDGEVVEDEQPVDDFETYNVLQRPHIAPRTEDTSKLRYSDDSDEPTESESDSDSDSAQTCAKKPKIKIRKRRNRVTDQKSSRDNKYKIWCMQVQEEALTEELVSCGVTNRDCQNRNVEFYDFTLRHPLNEEKNANATDSDAEKSLEPRLTNKRSNDDRTNIKLRLGKRKNAMEVDSQKGPTRKIADLHTTLESADADVARDIAEKLQEKKDNLIQRVVNIIGKQKAMEFFEQTKKIEEDGGMMIMNGSRRRTPGGVFLLLLKKDDHIPQEKIREIFEEDRKQHTEQRKQVQANCRRQKTQELMRSLENRSDKDLPALLTRAELSTRQIAEEARLRRGEGRERTLPDSERPVINPPPSPVTDDPDHSEHHGPAISSPLQRQVQDYTDDFLDIGVDVDSMELF